VLAMSGEAGRIGSVFFVLTSFVFYSWCPF
jgi:hypothetical protein